MPSLASVYKLILISKQVQQQIPTLKSHQIVYLFFVYAGAVMHPAAFIIQDKPKQEYINNDS